jgi:hypothetical protein
MDIKLGGNIILPPQYVHDNPMENITIVAEIQSCSSHLIAQVGDFIIFYPGWWYTYPSEKYESVSIMKCPTEKN